MIVKIKKAVVSENGLDSLLTVLEEIIRDAKSALELTKKVKEGKELTDSEYVRFLNLVNANETNKFVGHRLVAELFHLVSLKE